MASAPARTAPPTTDTAVSTITLVSVVVPAYDEEDVIGDTVDALGKMATEGRLEDVQIIVVDDGSTDATAARAADRGASTVRHPHNVGYGRSLKDGIAAAQHDTIVITDADGTYPIETIPRLLQEYERGFDMVVGARTGKVYHGPILKRALRLLLKFLVEFTAGRPVPDVNSGLRVFSRSTIMPYFPTLCEGFSFTTSVTLAYMMTGRFVTYIPVSYHERVGKTKVKIFRDALRTLQFIVEAIVYYNPIKIFVLVSFICGVAGLVSLAIGLGFSRLGFVIVGAALGVLVVLVFCLGLLAVLLKQIMDSRQKESD